MLLPSNHTGHRTGELLRQMDFLRRSHRQWEEQKRAIIMRNAPRILFKHRHGGPRQARNDRGNTKARKLAGSKCRKRFRSPAVDSVALSSGSWPCRHVLGRWPGTSGAEAKNQRRSSTISTQSTASPVHPRWSWRAWQE